MGRNLISIYIQKALDKIIKLWKEQRMKMKLSKKDTLEYKEVGKVAILNNFIVDKVNSINQIDGSPS